MGVKPQKSPSIPSFSENKTSSLQIGQTAPSFSVSRLNGKPFKLEDYKGKIVLIDFWATWCPPCIAEIPHYLSLKEKYKQSAFEIIGLSVDADPKTVRAFIKQHRLTYPVAMSLSEIEAAYGGIRSIPTTIVLDKNHNVAEIITGYRDQEYFEALIKKLL